MGRSLLAQCFMEVQFYGRRIRRIFPAWLFFLGVMAGFKLASLLPETSWRSFAAAALLIANIRGLSESLAHLWSLSLEEQYYLIWPFLFAWAGLRRIAAVALTLVMAVSLIRWIGVTQSFCDYQTGCFYMRPWFRFDSILWGSLLALYEKTPAATAFLRRLPALTGLVFLAGLLLVNQTMELWAWGTGFPHFGRGDFRSALRSGCRA